MSIIVKRATKGSALTSGEIDANVNNLNNDKVEINNPTFKAAPSLVNNLIPLTGTVLPAIYPSLNLDFANGKQLDPRITFSRNTVATYYDGKSVAVAEQNLVLNSQGMGVGSWVSVGITISPDQAVAPDGTTTGDLIYPTATGTGSFTYQQNSPDTTKVLSVYAKAAGLNFLAFRMQNNSASGYVWFDLINGTCTSLGTITNIGNGWYRCSAMCFSAGTSVSFSGCDASNSLTATASGTNGVYLWGAQLEQRSSVTAYTPTTSSPITNYIPVLKTAASNVPRIDYDPITKKCLGLLIEESRTNLLNYSSVFSNDAWTKGSSTFYHNYVIAPDGTQTATLLGPTVSVQPYHMATWVPGVTYVYSVYVKAITGKTISFRMSGVTTGDELRTFTASTGTIIRGSGVDVGSETATLVGNGWYRVVMVSVGRSNSSNYVSIEAGQGFAIWGAQLEVSGTTQTIRTSTIGVGSTTTDIVLDASASAVDGTYVGNKLTIANLARTITAYVGATKTVTVSVAFASAPSSGTTYYITPATMVVAGFATSYIPTTTTALSRAADTASMVGSNFSSWYNQSQGSFFVVYNGGRESGQSGYARIIGINSGPAGFLCSNGSTAAIVAYTGGLTTPLTVSGADFWDTGGKIALSYSPTTNIIAGNGFYSFNNSLGSDTFSRIQITQIIIGGPQYINGHIRKLTYYPKALTAVELQGLTS